jgi:lipopolysaccharide transport system ATP-binding protein
MSLAFRKVTRPPLRDFDAAAPDGVVIGVIGEDGSGKSQLLRLAAGAEAPDAGSLERSGPARLLGPMDPLDLDMEPAPVLLLDQTFARHDALVRHRGALALDRMRRAGSTILLASHDEDLLLRLADEIWWLGGGSLAARGDPGEVLAGYRKHIARQERAWGETADSRLSSQATALAPRMRRGDGRAEVLRIETIGANGRPTIVWRSGEVVTVRVAVRFRQAVDDPVVGMMIRTRIGLNVYGTNTELEGVKPGPCAAGETREISFTFPCDLCPGEYTLTAASHDPDGVWHDWLEDAVAFAVSDDRYTAGVANLRARVTSNPVT